MCRWVQHHYGACRHQHTYLEEFCSHSMAVTTLPPHKKAPEETTTLDDSLWTPDSRGNPFGGSGGPPQRAGSHPPAGASNTIPPPPPSCSSKRSSKHHCIHPSSTFSDNSFTPIAEETAEDIASLEGQQQHQRPLVSPRRFSEPAPKDMAGFAPFGKSTFRHLMGGGGSSQLAIPVTTTRHHNDREELVGLMLCVWRSPILTLVSRNQIWISREAPSLSESLASKTSPMRAIICPTGQHPLHFTLIVTDHLVQQRDLAANLS